MKLTKLTYDQHRALLCSPDFARTPMKLGKTVVEIQDEDVPIFAHDVSQAIARARGDRDRGLINALSSIARKLEAQGVYVNR